MRNSVLGSRFWFGDFVLYPEAGELHRRGVHITTARPLEIALLALLVERAGQKIPRIEIESRLWPNERPSKNRLNVLISAARSNLGDTSPIRRKYIATVAGGYCFIHPIKRIERVSDVVSGLEEENAYRSGRRALEDREDSSIRRAVALFKKSVDLKPSYASGWVALADAYILSAIHCVDCPRDAFLKARAAAEEAARIDPSLPDTLVAAGMAKLCVDQDWSAAEAMFLAALKVNPKLHYAHNGLALLQLATGRAGEGVMSMEHSQRHNPLSAATCAILSHKLCIARRFDDAIEIGRKAVLADPESGVAHSCLGIALRYQGSYEEALVHFKQAKAISHESKIDMGFWGHACGIAGMRDEAHRALDTLLSLPRHEYVPSYFVGLIHLGLGSFAEAIQWFHRACDDCAHWVILLNTDPALDRLRCYEEFSKLLGRIGNSGYNPASHTSEPAVHCEKNDTINPNH